MLTVLGRHSTGWWNGSLSTLKVARARQLGSEADRMKSENVFLTATHGLAPHSSSTGGLDPELLALWNSGQKRVHLPSNDSIQWQPVLRFSPEVTLTKRCEYFQGHAKESEEDEVGTHEKRLPLCDQDKRKMQQIDVILGPTTTIN
ncbi:hypothetical protein PGT21_019740 [Puccinia graminis f. sp. tritici]|uniref:Uncharacterized protein n=1 Tax=Puccinia graminis f. sp. tritici TaxID=56615 RepID=A0A5B0QGB0_PUCGR|nr:hypothetical protein PGT21_019740 [Puccinia graminis f. sp. tritici]